MTPTQSGLLYGVGAYLWWGLAPLYFKAIAHVSPVEVLAHRVTWSLGVLALLLALSRQWRTAAAALRDPSVRLRLLATSALIATNWLVFIWAIANHRLVEASLGYFINPLVNVALGVLLLGERLRPLQVVAVLLAAAGVTLLTLRLGHLPWVALVLAFSFALYGLLRKTARVESLVGLSLETLLLAPLSVAYLLWAPDRHFLAHSTTTDLLLLSAGVVTSVPLLWFATAARRLRLTTVGLLQYLAPSAQLAIATLLFGEPFTPTHALSFGLIWTALLLYTSANLPRLRRTPA